MDYFESLVVKHIRNESSEEETNELSQLLRESEENRNIYKQISKTSRLVDSQNIAINIKEHWLEVENKLVLKTKKRNKTLMFASAVAAMLLIGLFSWMVFQSKIPQTQWELAQSNNTKKQITLSDGTEIHLNKNSELEFPTEFPQNQRLVKLKGEAFFKVKPNKEKPFIIETQNTKTKVLGTSFNIRSYPEEEIELIEVFSGIVEFTDNYNHSTILKKQMSAIFSKAKEELELKLFNTNSTAWISREFIFKDASLLEVMQSLQEVFEFQFTIKNTVNKDEKITTKIKNMKIEEAMDLLSISLDFEYQIENNHITIK